MEATQPMNVISAPVAAAASKMNAERRFALNEVGAALEQVGAGHAQGQIVVRVAS